MMIDYAVVSPEVSAIEQEIASQPGCWRKAAAVAPELADRLPSLGARLAVIGCGTSLYMAQAYAVARETAGAGETDAFAASEMPPTRHYDAVLAISRSGTTTEVVRMLEAIHHSVSTHAVVGVAGTPVADVADRAAVLDFADEESVVQTRFATTALVFLLAGPVETVMLPSSCVTASLSLGSGASSFAPVRR